MKFNRKEIGNFTELVLRIWTAFFVFIYGAAKPLQFGGGQLPEVALNEATSFQIMWAFFAVTKVYPIAIGIMQITGAFLLLFKRTKLLGAIWLTPIFLNIITLDILYKIPAGALMNAVVFQLVFLYIMYAERKQVIAAFQKLTLAKKEGSTKDRVIYFAVAAIAAACWFFIYTWSLQSLGR